VIVVERTDDGGGSTRDSGGNIRTFKDTELAVQHYAHLSYGSTAVDVIRAMVETASTLPDWMVSHGVSKSGEILATRRERKGTLKRFAPSPTRVAHSKARPG